MKCLFTILFGCLYAVGAGFAQSAPIATSTPFGNEEEMRTLLEKIFPGDPLVKTLVLQVVPVEEDHSLNAHSGRGIIRINQALIDTMEGNENYLGYILGHEAGHLEADDSLPVRWTTWFSYEEDLGLLERQDVSADRFAVLHMRSAGFDVCSLSPWVEKVYQKLKIYDRPEEVHNAIMLRRLDLLKTYCTDPSTLAP